MTETNIGAGAPASAAEIQKAWLELTLRVGQLEIESKTLELKNKELRSLLETVIEHRQKSHNELVLLLTNLVSKLPMNEAGAMVARLVEHNTNVSQFLAALVHGTVGANLPQPIVLKTLEQSKRDLLAALTPVVEELRGLDTPIESELLQAVSAKPEMFFAPQFLRADRCFVKGYVPRERILREFGPSALMLFNDMTTDPKLNPRPKPEEIVLEFKNDFEALFQQNPAVAQSKRQELLALHQKVQRSKANSEQARAQKNAFLRLSFLIELLHFYEHQETEAPDVIFANRLPGLIEQLVLLGPADKMDEQSLALAESLLGFISSSAHRLMVINNVGKGGGAGKTLKFLLRLRAEKTAGSETDHVILEFVKHLLSSETVPPTGALAVILRLLAPEMQRLVVRVVMHCDRIRKDQAEALGKALATELGLKGLIEQVKTEAGDPAQLEGIRAWARIKDLISRRSDAGTIAAAIRDRLHAKYDAEEIKQSWVTIIEADSLSMIKIICQLPYLADGKTDSIARTILESHVTRLTHEKYAGTYKKVVNSLKSMFSTRPDNPTVVNFMALVRWVSPEAANKMSHDIGMPAPV
jgi:hypothetical protein